MKKFVPVIVVVVILAAAGFAAWYAVSNQQQAISVLGGSGTIESDQLTVSPLTGGKVLKAPFAEGDAIKRGQLLYQLDASVVDQQVKQAKAGVDAAAAALKQVKDDSNSTDADVAAAEAQLAQANATLAIARTQASYTKVVAPAAGVAADKMVDAGENVTPGQNLMVISNPASLTVSIFVPETRIGEVKVGQKGELTVDGLSTGRPVRVVFISDQAEFTPSTVQTKDQRVNLVFRVKCAIDDPKGLKAGMPADVVLAE
jgi:HlyD family secretion protein